MFDKVFENAKIDLVEEDLQFYNEISKPANERYVKERLYQSYSNPTEWCR